MSLSPLPGDLCLCRFAACLPSRLLAFDHIWKFCVHTHELLGKHLPVFDRKTEEQAAADHLNAEKNRKADAEATAEADAAAKAKEAKAAKAKTEEEAAAIEAAAAAAAAAAVSEPAAPPSQLPRSTSSAADVFNEAVCDALVDFITQAGGRVKVDHVKKHLQTLGINKMCKVLEKKFNQVRVGVRVWQQYTHRLSTFLGVRRRPRRVIVLVFVVIVVVAFVAVIFVVADTFCAVHLRFCWFCIVATVVTTLTINEHDTVLSPSAAVAQRVGAASVQSVRRGR
eukprot:COSAG05_NODE_1494_length_4714_cov_41.398267_3_plen_282_part_00